MILATAIATLLSAPASAHIPAQCTGEGTPGAELANAMQEQVVQHAEISAALETGATDSMIALMVFRLVRNNENTLNRVVMMLECVAD
ncbi:MAG: hypothetical protein OXF79_01825 [Chloroflexi bacterium]|nr:hypothetical protein [Chloroflexota bacterium]